MEAMNPKEHLAILDIFSSVFTGGEGHRENLLASRKWWPSMLILQGTGQCPPLQRTISP